MFDGLDEMPERDRLALADAISVFATANSGVRVVVTARPAGFRTALPRLASFQLCAIAPLSLTEIGAFVQLWQRSIDGDSSQTDDRSREILRRLRGTERALQLARNPLMLSILLLVRRGGGDLPEQRSALYDETLRVLLSSWNVEAHDPIRREQAIPLLAWLSFEMTRRKDSRVAEAELNRTLRDAMRGMPEYFSYDVVAPERFAENVELRSSILVNVGREISDGWLQTVYEFRHLTLQEYLAAVAIADGHCAPVANGLSLGDAIGPHLGDDFWQEIIPLVAVRLGRRSETLLKTMIAIVTGYQRPPRDGNRHVTCTMLTQCLLDQVPAHPDLIAEAADAVFGLVPPGRSQLEALARGPYAQPVADAAADCVADDWRLEEAADAVGTVVRVAARTRGFEVDSRAWRLPSWSASVLASYAAFEVEGQRPLVCPTQGPWADVGGLLESRAPGLRLLAARRIAVSALQCRRLQASAGLVLSLYEHWQRDRSQAVQRSAAAALAGLLSHADTALPRELPNITAYRLRKEMRAQSSAAPGHERAAILAVASRFALWTDEETAEIARTFSPTDRWSALVAAGTGTRKGASLSGMHS
jgi:hypothetical protein